MIIKNINLGKIKFYLIIILIVKFVTILSYANDNIYYGKTVDIKILDKLSSKNKLIKIKVGEDYIFKNLSLKKC